VKEPYPDAFQGVVELEERDLGFEIGGRVTAVAVKEGDAVSDGQPLATLDATLEQAMLATRNLEAESAEAELALVQAGNRSEDIGAMQAELQAAKAVEAQFERTVSRERALLERGVTPQAAFDEVQSNLDAARARSRALAYRVSALAKGARKEEVESVRARTLAVKESTSLEQERLERHELKAPAAGTIVDVHIDPGEVVGAATPVVTLADTQHPYTDVFVPQKDIAAVQVGMPARIFVDANPEGFSAHVESVGRRTEFTPRYLFSIRERVNLVVRVKVRIDDPEQKLHAGVPAFVRLDASGK
jgi:HlyD family secretion protein